MTKQRPSHSGLRQSGFLRAIRTLFAACAWLFAAGVVLQVFFAGLGVLVEPSYFAWHETFAQVLGPLLSIMLVVGAIGRVGWRAFGLNALLFVLFALQYFFIYVFQGPLRALHVVNALALFWLAVNLGQRSWQLTRAAQPTLDSSAPSFEETPSRAARKEGFSVGRQLLGSLAVVVGAVVLFGIIFDNGPGLFSFGGPGVSSQQVSSQQSEQSELNSVSASEEATQTEGKAIFAQNCSSCHGDNGGGGFGPALADNSDLANTEKMVRQVLNGGGGMPDFKKFSAEEMAAVTTFIRSSWGNDFGAVAADAVKPQR